jgi:B12-binding domain/radical SAM domain protein
MLRDPRFDVERFLARLEPRAFGLDLHWMPHVQGSLEVARIVKRLHPRIPVIFGGLSATYYHRELLDYPQVDYVVRGDSAEEPLRMLLRSLVEGAEPDLVPNVSWRRGAELRCNELSAVPEDLDGVEFSYEAVIRMVLRYRDLASVIPFRDWLAYPATAVLTCRGCQHDCGTCGGSESTYGRMAGRPSPAFRPPERLAADLARIERYIRAPVLILGDVREAGDEYARRFLSAVRERRLRNQIVFELFRPAAREFLTAISRSVRKFNLEISPESHSEDVRSAFGRRYSNEELERTIADALALGAGRIDLFFMIGLPLQTPESVRETVRYCGSLLDRFGRTRQVRPFIAPLAPFLDPGSRIFENPAPNGYRLYYRTLEEHRQAMDSARSWREMLNYETVWMDRDQIVDSTYSAVSELVRLKSEHGLVSRQEAERTRRRMDEAARLVEELRSGRGGGARWEERVAALNRARPPEKWELRWPTAILKMNLPRMLACRWKSGVGRAV